MCCCPLAMELHKLTILWYRPTEYLSSKPRIIKVGYLGIKTRKSGNKVCLARKPFGGWSSEQHKFRNPIRQNLAHFGAVRDILKDIGEFTIIPIVAFSDSADLNITTPNHTVINWCNLRSVIKSYRTPTISPDNIERIVTKLSTANITTKGSRELHTRQVQSIQQNIDLAIANRRCPKCGGNLIERRGKYGNFLGCSNYPNCRFTHKY